MKLQPPPFGPSRYAPDPVSKMPRARVRVGSLARLMADAMRDGLEATDALDRRLLRGS
jgi:hypothetical protein